MRREKEKEGHFPQKYSHPMCVASVGLELKGSDSFIWSEQPLIVTENTLGVCTCN